MINKIMNPISWLLVFVFRVICTFPLVFIIGFPTLWIINIVIFDSSIGFYYLMIFTFVICLVTSISTVLETDF